MEENQQSLDQSVEKIYDPPNQQICSQHPTNQYYDNLIKTVDNTVAAGVGGAAFGLISTVALTEVCLNADINSSYFGIIELAGTLIGGALGALMGYVAAKPSS